MKEKMLHTLYRYDKEDKSYHAVIDLDTYRDVYSTWDYSPINYRDLDDDLLDFLMDCSSEIGLNRKMIIDFYIPAEIVNSEREQKSINGFRNYFFYRIRKIKSERMIKIKNSILLFFIGITLISMANFFGTFILNQFLSRIVTEGLSIGGWVSLWELLNTIFFDVRKLTYTHKHYKRLQNVPINYNVKT